MKKWYWFLFILLITGLTTSEGCGGKDTFGCNCEITKVIEKTLYLDSSNLSGALSVYGATGEFEADAACHAQMSLKFYWQNNEMQMTEERPPINYTFEAGFGYFPANDYISGDANSGYMWTANTDEAQDKNALEGTNYAITVNYNASTHPEETVVCELKII
jgi:hypothetical protein